MGSIGNQNPWSPYDNYRDCSQGVCTIYCPQFCYLIFPPPPPSDDDSTAPFSPLIVAVIGVLASAFLLVCYFTVVKRFCSRRNGSGGESQVEQEQVASAGLDDSLIKTIAVCRYTKGGGLIEGSECAVCLCEFEENQALRLLPKCSHAFHLPCIDTWLKSQSNCPLCRADVEALGHPPSPTLDMNAYASQMTRDMTVVVDDGERNQQIVVICDEAPRPSPLLIWNILKLEEIVEIDEVPGSSREYGANRMRPGELLRSPVASAKKKFSPNARALMTKARI